MKGAKFVILPTKFIFGLNGPSRDYGIQWAHIGILLLLLRLHRSEWASNNRDDYLAAAINVGHYSLLVSHVGNYSD